MFLTSKSSAQIFGCCDENSADYIDHASAPCAADSPWDGEDSAVCDPDCVNDYSVCVEGSECYDPNDPACSIPLDGGLSLLAFAGGGLATAAMRRRREEEEAAQGAA
jgi:hypothetical protein